MPEWSSTSPSPADPSGTSRSPMSRSPRRPWAASRSSRRSSNWGIRGRNLTDAGMVHVRGLTNLKKFLIGDCQVTDEGLVNLEGLTRLEWVSLGEHAINRSWPEAPSETPPSWRPLHLHRSRPLSAKFRNESLSIFADFPSLKFLSIAFAGLSDAGLERLKGMNRLPDSVLPERCRHRRGSSPT